MSAVLTKTLPQGPLIFIASIGNPAKYDGTRHSVGHHVLQKLISHYGAIEVPIGSQSMSSIQGSSVEIPAEPTKAQRRLFIPKNGPSQVIFHKCKGYMNVSGESLKPVYKQALRYTKEQGREMHMVVLFDELDLDVGKVKLRKPNLSHRGHNGLRSIQGKIGKNYHGVQIGIGREYSGHKDDKGVVADYVLSKFTNEQLDIIDDQSVQQVISLIDEMRVGKYVNE